MKTLAVIPARLGSTRLPRKVLADIHGHPLIWHVWQRVKQASNIDDVIIAADSEEVRDVVESFGANVLLTSPECQSGTERIASLIDQLDADFILNVQGDEPLVDPKMLDALVAKWVSSPCDLITPIYRITDPGDLANPNVVKVARVYDGRALYFSRSPIPFVRGLPMENWLEKQVFWGHIGVYGYRVDVLRTFFKLKPSTLQQAESLEQLKFLEAGYAIQTLETDYHSVAVDTIDDLEKVRRLISK